MAPDGILQGHKHISDEFDPAVFFTGNLRASGVFIDRFGTVKRRFTVLANGIPKNNGINLHETFTYDDGEIEKRVWSIKRLEENRFQGITEDLVGTCIGTSRGPLFSWSYYFYLKIFGRQVKVHFDDIMVRLSHDTILNRARITKWGVLIGDVHLTFQRQSNDELRP